MNRRKIPRILKNPFLHAFVALVIAFLPLVLFTFYGLHQVEVRYLKESDTSLWQSTTTSFPLYTDGKEHRVEVKIYFPTTWSIQDGQAGSGIVIKSCPANESCLKNTNEYTQIYVNVFSDATWEYVGANPNRNNSQENWIKEKFSGKISDLYHYLPKNDPKFLFEKYQENIIAEDLFEGKAHFSAQVISVDTQNQSIFLSRRKQRQYRIEMARKIIEIN